MLPSSFLVPIDSRLTRKEDSYFSRSIVRLKLRGSLLSKRRKEKLVRREHSEFLLLLPFQVHSLTPPVANIVSQGFLSGRKCSRRMISMKFDFPLPLVPMRMLSGRSSIGSVLGNNERRLTGWIDFKLDRKSVV